MDYTSFHCKIEITRHLENDIHGEDIITSHFQRFFSKMPTSLITIGSSSKSSIIVAGIKKTHCSFYFDEGTLSLKVMGNLVLTHEEDDILLGDGDIYTLEFSSNELVDFYRLLDWTIRIDDKITIKGAVILEDGVEKENIENYLIQRYGFAEKLNESERHLVYKIAENQVVKILHPHYNKEHSHIENFCEAAKQLYGIEDDILPKIDAAYSDFPHATINFFAGETLENYLAKKGKVSYREAFLVVKKIARLLVKTREKNYICKNLNPKNILCAGSKKIKFTGWNVSYEKNTGELDSIFLAPEYIHRRLSLTCAVDIYSLGVITFSLITGKSLFSSTEEYKMHVANGLSFSKDDLQKKSVYITPQVSIFLQLMLSLEPENRPTPSGILDWIKDIFDVKLWKQILHMDKEKKYYGLQVISSVQPMQGEICPLENNKSFIIGRRADINIPGDYKISRKHTKITLDNGICILEDLGSSNGTKINGEKVAECKLENGTSFLVGETTLSFWDYNLLRHERQKLLTQVIETK